MNDGDKAEIICAAIEEAARVPIIRSEELHIGRVRSAIKAALIFMDENEGLDCDASLRERLLTRVWAAMWGE